jgi:LuxR family maltose regulon positive regulatory protein
MAGGSTLPERLLKMLKNGFFISYIADKGVYSLHSILNDYLKQRFENQPREFAEVMIRRAGAACAAASDYFPAAQFFSRVRDYGAILSMPLTTSYLNEQKEKDIAGFLERIVGECPEQTLQEYPFAVLTFAFQFMKSGKGACFWQMVRLLRAIADTPSGLPESTVSRIRGETALLLSFTEFNDIAKMSAYHREALLHLNMSDDGAPPKTVVFGSTPWTFGVTSALCLYWSKSGELDTELALMGECMPWYVKLSTGHGAGADSVMRAEACLYRGEETEAEAASHKALYQARSARQTCISLCEELVLAQVPVRISKGIPRKIRRPHGRPLSCLARSLTGENRGNSRLASRR